jgi:dextransucrase
MISKMKKGLTIALIVNLIVVTIVTSVQFPYTPVSAKTTDNIQGFISSEELDERLIFQGFTLYLPDEKDMYTTFSRNINLLKRWGVTDVWAPPAYRAFEGSYYFEGYSVADRYDLGEFPQGPNGERATKYGTSDELKSLISRLHNQGIRVQADLVPNQMIGLAKPEVVSVTSVDNYGNPNDPDFVDKLVPVYSKGGGKGQEKYGLINEWNHTYLNGTSPQHLGRYRLMVDQDGTHYRYFGPDDSNNYLPEWLAHSDAAKYDAINTIDTYLTVDGYYAAENADTTDDQVWVPLLLHYKDPQPGAINENYLDYMSANGFDGKTDQEVRENIIAADSEEITQLTSDYIHAQPGYSAETDPRGNLRFNKEDNSNVNKNNLQYEFLVGSDIDNSNPTVQAEQLNWAKFLLDEYNFDGFRIDAASHFNTKILTDFAELMSSRYGDDLNNHLSYIESYTDNQVDFLNNNNNGQLAYDHHLYGALMATLGSASSWRPLSDIVSSSYVNRTDTSGAEAIPNWSFVNNHDQEHNILREITLTEEEANGTEPGTREYEEYQYEKYFKDMEKTDKQYAPRNVPSQYAYMLTNKDTVPTVFYGDLYKSNASYMSEKTIYYDTIDKLMKARNNYVSGDQEITYYSSNTSETPGHDLLASVRFGTDRSTGIATVIGNNPDTDTTINVDMGELHANQRFVDITGFNSEVLTTDENGILTVDIKGVSNPQVHGYLGVWVPRDNGFVGGKSDKAKNADNGIKASVNNQGNKDTKPENNNENHGKSWRQNEVNAWQQWIRRNQNQ